MDTLLLWHIPLSHYNEKARWALDYRRIAHHRQVLGADYLIRAWHALSVLPLIPERRFLICIKPPADHSEFEWISAGRWAYWKATLVRLQGEMREVTALFTDIDRLRDSAATTAP